MLIIYRIIKVQPGLRDSLEIDHGRLPAVDEVGDGVVDTKGRCVQVSADFHVVSGHQTNGCLVLVVKDLPLQRGAEQQHEVIWKRRKRNTSKSHQTNPACFTDTTYR